MKTITRRELIECIISDTVPINHCKHSIICDGFEVLTNVELCDILFEKIGVLLVPKTSTILEFLN